MAVHKTPIPVTKNAWGPYGWIPVQDVDPTDGKERLSYTWDDAHVNIIGHTLEEVPVIENGIRCEMLYRHATHTQVLMPLDHECVIVVAKASDGPKSTDEIEVFTIQPLESVVLHKATWHWGPFPTKTEKVQLFNVQGLRYAEDNDMVDLASQGLSVDVDLS